MSYQLNISPKDRFASRFISRVVKELQRSFAESKANHKTTQQSLATKLGVERSTVNKALAGRNLTLRTIADLSWALDCEINFSIRPKVHRQHSNVFTESASQEPSIKVFSGNMNTVTSSSGYPAIVIRQYEPAIQQAVPPQSTVVAH